MSGPQLDGVCYCCMFINIQLIIDESLSQGFPQSNQSVYKNGYVRNAAIRVLVRIAQ